MTPDTYVDDQMGRVPDPRAEAIRDAATQVAIGLSRVERLVARGSPTSCRQVSLARTHIETGILWLRDAIDELEQTGELASCHS